MTLCCAGCFNDAAIIQFIGLEHTNNRCGYCRADNAFTIEPQKLSSFFEPFLGIMKEDENGDFLSDIIQNIFKIFNDKIGNQKKLLSEILGAEYTEKKYKLLEEYKNHLSQWDDFKKEIKYKNRFFPQNSMYSLLFDTREGSADADLFQIIEQLKVTYNADEYFFRARINDIPLDNTKMGKPPEGNATAGRANPTGISYLYLAENENTCVAEVRPNNTSIVYISKCTLKKDVNLIDLTSPRKRMSICSFDENRYNNVISILNLLEILSYELSKPVKPESSNIDYIPTQFICEFLKSFSRCDGIIFESSFGLGKNFVFYDDDAFQIDDPVANKITGISHSFEPN